MVTSLRLPGRRPAAAEDSASLRRWETAADTASKNDPATLRKERSRALALRRRIDRFLHIAEDCLALPRPGSAALRRPLHADWADRPSLWAGPVEPSGRAAVPSDTRLGEAATLFHDCPLGELTYRQLRNTGPEDTAPFGLVVEVFDFEGSYLSIVLELPAPAMRDLGPEHVIGVALTLDTESPLEVFTRLNIRHGPDTEEIVRELPASRGGMETEFDLGYAGLGGRRVERMWLDLIFEGPRMNRITVSDLTLWRRPRAAF